MHTEAILFTNTLSDNWIVYILLWYKYNLNTKYCTGKTSLILEEMINFFQICTISCWEWLLVLFPILQCRYTFSFMVFVLKYIINYWNLDLDHINLCKIWMIEPVVLSIFTIFQCTKKGDIFKKSTSLMKMKCKYHH